MKNKLITAVLTLSLLSPVAISQASGANAPVLAILDTAIDTSIQLPKESKIKPGTLKYLNISSQRFSEFCIPPA